MIGLCLALILAACADREPAVAPYTTDAATDTWLVQHRERSDQAVAHAHQWLDGIEIDPAALRSQGIKGKKKLVELVDAYERLAKIAPDDPTRKEILDRITHLVEVTKGPAYHDMASVSDDVFKEESTSYLRLAVVLKRLGFDVTDYRREILAIQPRLDDHLARRGPFQRAAFHTYYQELGLTEPFPLADGLAEGVIAHRVDPNHFSLELAYLLTHEVFAPYDYGDRLDVEPFDAATLAYLRDAIAVLLRGFLQARDPDIVAELVSSARMLRFVDLPEYREGLAFLLDEQKADGSWGHYEAERPTLGDLVKVNYELHTTVVALDALTLAFHPAWNRAVEPVVVAAPPP